MEQKVLKTNVYVNETIFKENSEVPIDIDFTLPDYCPDISKIFKCHSVPRISSKSINGNMLTVEGSVCITLIYCDKDGKEVFLDSYECNEGEKFYDLFLDKKEVEGYTSLGYLDENGKPWNKAFTHPGGDSDVAVKVYLDLIEGEYTLVETYKEFRNAITRNENIYLLNDIDFDGRNREMCFDSYSGEILGNGHKLMNLTVDYNTLKSGLKGELNEDGTLDNSSRNTLYISLFFELEDATIKDLTFENLIIDVDTSLKDIDNIVISPLAIIAKNVNLSNVHISGNIEYSKLPDKEINIKVVENGYSVYSENVNATEDCTIDVVNNSVK